MHDKETEEDGRLQTCSGGQCQEDQQKSWQLAVVVLYLFFIKSVVFTTTGSNC